MTGNLEFTAELLARIILAAFCGIAIGYERMNHFKAAGVKTHMIVGMSAALMMIVSKYGFSDSNSFDAARVAAQIVSGVGFLGAGIIYKKNQMVQGLTTAAGIWATAGVGMALGSGLYYIGGIGTVIFILLRVLVQNIERFQNGLQESYCIKLASVEDMNEALSLCDKLKVIAYTIEKQERNGIKLDVTLLFSDQKQKNLWIQEILSRSDILRFEHY